MEGRADLRSRLGTGTADRFMVVVAVVAPGAEHHVAGAQVARDEVGDVSLAVEQRVVGKPAAYPFQTVHRQAEPAQGFDAFLGTEYAQAFFRPLS